MKEERIEVLNKLSDYILSKLLSGNEVRMNFICTHNSRRSHLAQIWSQVALYELEIHNVYCYSGGTEATALFPKVADTLRSQGLIIGKISNGINPVYSIKVDVDAPPIIAFSKVYDHPFNPASQFVAVMTCNQADENCPFIPGAEKRIAVTYNDPKGSDGTTAQDKVYLERSEQIKEEMFYVFQKVKSKFE
jgi:arsenate reductase